MDHEKHLTAMSAFIESLNPKLAVFYRISKTEIDAEAKQDNENEPVTEITSCIFCGSPLKPGTRSLKLLSRQAFTPRVCRLMQKYAKNPKSLGHFQLKLMNDFKTSRNRLRVTCFTCKKSWKIDGQSSLERLKQKKEIKSKSTVEEKPKTKQEKKKDKKKALRKKRLLQLSEEDVNAGLKKVKSELDDKQNTETISNVDGHQSLLQHKTRIKDEQKQTVDKTIKPIMQKSDILEKVQGDDPALSFKSQPFRERKKQRFASQLSAMLKREKNKEKGNGQKDQESKSSLEAFLTSL